MAKFKEEIFYKVIEALLQGKSNEQITTELPISKKTISEYIKKLQDKKSPYYNQTYYDSILFIREAKFGKFIDKDLLEEIIEDIYNGYTVLEISDRHFVSERTVQNYLGALKDETSSFYDVDEYKNIEKIREKYTILKNKIGGMIGKREKERSDEIIRSFAEHIIAYSRTLKEASEELEIPISTLYDNIRSIEDDEIQSELDDVFDSHRLYKR